MKKIHKIAISTILALSAIMFIVVAAWAGPICAYAYIIPAVLAVVGISYFFGAFFSSKNTNKNSNKRNTANING